jgi:hypothetical protein
VSRRYSLAVTVRLPLQLIAQLRVRLSTLHIRKFGHSHARSCWGFILVMLRPCLLLAAVLLVLTPVIERAFLHESGSKASAAPLTLLTMEPGTIGQSTRTPGYDPFYMGGYGTYSGTAPTRATGTWNGCGGGAAVVQSITADVYGPGTYLVQVTAPGTAGACTLTITDNLGRQASSPPANVKMISDATVISNVHNAPGWLPAHGYAPAGGPRTRVLSGPGWTPESKTWNPGRPLSAYQLISDGSCTSASSGGPSGTGASISDGTCTWKYLSGVDYITLTGYSFDAPLWVSGTTYTFGQYVTTNVGGILRAYALDGIRGNQNAFCTSTVAPSGAPTNGGTWWQGSVTTSDGCVWDYMADIVYSSQVSSIPVQTFANTFRPPAAVVHMAQNYQASIWNDAEYVAGANHENNPLATRDHFSGRATEQNLMAYCPSGCKIIYQPAAGEGFRDTLRPSMPLIGYDATKGVALRNPNPSSIGYAAEPAGFFGWDWGIRVNGLQMKSAAGAGYWGFNGQYITDCIIDGGFNNRVSQGYAVWLDASNILVNSLIISHGKIGVGIKYGDTFLLFDTIANVGTVSGAVAVAQAWDWVFQKIVISDTAIYGFPHAASYLTLEGAQTYDPSSANNVTDTAREDSGLTWWDNGQPSASTVVIIPGTTYGTPQANMFVKAGADWRPGSALVGAGGGYGNFRHGCPSKSERCVPTILNYDLQDFIGTSRPQAGSWTVGAEQHP